MSKIFKIPLAKPDKISWAELKGTVITLCIVGVLFFAAAGCGKKAEVQIVNFKMLIFRKAL